jgi:hypothetical protein
MQIDAADALRSIDWSYSNMHNRKKQNRRSGYFKFEKSPQSNGSGFKGAAVHCGASSKIKSDDNHLLPGLRQSDGGSGLPSTAEPLRVQQLTAGILDCLLPPLDPNDLDKLKYLLRIKRSVE